MQNIILSGYDYQLLRLNDVESDITKDNENVVFHISANSSDLSARLARSRSVARSRGAELRDGWRHPGYGDLVVGSRAHPGHHFPR